jgi:hypothetical protein
VPVFTGEQGAFTGEDPLFTGELHRIPALSEDRQHRAGVSQPSRRREYAAKRM